MVYEKDGYRLFKRVVKLRGGHQQTIYFFSKREPVSGEPTRLPRGYRVAVNAKTGLPYLKKE